MKIPSQFPQDDEPMHKKMRGWTRATEVILSVLLILTLGLAFFIAIELW
jgi:hypothetical protein